MTPRVAPSHELMDLMCDLAEDRLSPEGGERLDALLCADPMNCQHYIDFMATITRLAWIGDESSDAEGTTCAGSMPQGTDSLLALPASRPPVDSAAVESTSDLSGVPQILLTDALPSTAPHLLAGWPLAYGVAIVVLGIGLSIGRFVQVHSPDPVATGSSPVANGADPSATETQFVGRVTGMADCRWSDDRTAAFDRAPVALGRKYALASGLMEITYDTGAKVILQGPCTYEVESAAGGYLSIGKLTARLEKKEEGEAKIEELSASRSSFLIPHFCFAVRTPTATVTDLGTEFGVEVSKEGVTTSHVFRGSVEVRMTSAEGTATGDAKVVHADESVLVECSSENRRIVPLSSFASSTFVREIPKRTIRVLDLVDVVAGGDGFSGRRSRGVDPTSGRSTDTTVENYDGVGFPSVVGDGKYHRAKGLPLVDGVFIPDGRSGSVQVDSAGHTFAEFRETSNMTAGNIWAGGLIPVPSSTMPSNVSSLLESLPPSHTLVRSKLGNIDYASPGHGLIFMHANKGITFDLEGIRRANPGCKLMRFRATAGNTEPMAESGAVAGHADLWVLVDGQVRFRRRELNGTSGAFAIVLPIAEGDRFLTLAATDSGDTMAGDWILFGDPVLEMVTSKQKGE